MTLHRPGGHERNLATRAETANYALGVAELARSIAPSEGEALLRGPVHGTAGKANVSASAFDDDLVMTVSFAPLGSDDIDTKVEASLAGPAAETGFDLSVVDAHNSIDPNLESPATDDPGWKRLFEATREAKAAKFSVAYSNSSEIGFMARGDLTENGLSLLLVKKQDAKSVLVLADANNSTPGLREAVRRSLQGSGYELIEFCTSDSHNLAARGLTVERGYQALGEATPTPSIAEAVVKLAKLAESRLAPAHYGSATSRSRVRVFGSRALEEFAAITQVSSRFARNYFGLAGAAVAALLFISLLY
jgi:putative membrane protein